MHRHTDLTDITKSVNRHPKQKIQFIDFVQDVIDQISGEDNISTILGNKKIYHTVRLQKEKIPAPYQKTSHKLIDKHI